MPITRRDYFKPIQIGGSVLWLDGADPAGTGTAPANGSTLTTWVDKSGAGRTLIVGSGTTTYANSAITLANSYMYIASAIDLTNFSFFIIAKTNSATNNQTVFGARPNTVSLLTSSDGFGFYMDFQTAIRFFGNNTAGQFINQSIVTSNPNIFSFTSGSTVINGWLDGSPVSGATGLATRTTTAQGFAIGAEWSGSAYGNIVSTASIYEIIVYNQALSTPQRQQVEAYLAQKWTLTSYLPTGHPGLTSVLYRGVTNTLTKSVYYTQFSPKSIPGASLWLDGADPAGNGVVPANNTTITTWNDKSGQANHVSGTATLTNNAMTFNGTTQAFSNISYVFPYTAYSMFAVYANTTAPAATSYMNAVYADGGYPMLGVYDVNNYVSASSMYANTGALAIPTLGQITSVGWAAQMTAAGNAIATDSNGNVFVTGYYEAAATLYNIGGTTGTTLPFTGGYDIFVAKYSSTGAVVWAAQITGANTSTDIGYGIATDSNGNVFVTGRYLDALTLYNADGTSGTTLPFVANVGYATCFVVKYTSAGVVSWAARIANVNSAFGYAIAIDPSGNVLVTGLYQSTLTVYNQGPSGTAFATTLTAVGGGDCFIAKYSSAGAVVWVARIAGPGEDSGLGITTDPSGNVFVTGYYNYQPPTAYSSDTTAYATTLANSGGDDVFLVKYSSTGFVQWVTRLTGAATFPADRGLGITTDPSGNVLVTGYYGGYNVVSGVFTLYNAGGVVSGATLPLPVIYDAFIAKYSSAGTVVWATQLAAGETNRIQGGHSEGNAIATDSNGNVFVTGYYNYTLKLYNTGGVGGTTLTPNGYDSIFVAKYTSAGAASWATRIAGAAHAYGNAIATDSNGNVFVTGSYSAAMTLYNTNETTGATVTNASTTNCFIAKYTSSGYISTATAIPVIYTNIPASSNVLVSATYTSSTFSPFISGTPTTTFAGPTYAATGIYIGGPLNYFNGSISEVIIYSTTLSASQRQLVESYLSQKWRLTTALPASHINNTFPAGSPAALQTYITNIKTNFGYSLYLPGTPSINAPTNTGNITVLTMTWTAPAVIGTAGTVTGYIVYILAGGNLVAGTGIGTGGTQTLGNILTTTFSPMTTNLNYSYYVTAVGPGGTGVASSTSSSAIYYATPTAPTVGTATNTGNLTTLTMTWTAGSGTTTYYTVYVVVGGSTVATLTPGNVLTTTYSPMTTNLAYTFYVTGTNTIAGATSGSSATSGSAIYYATPGAPTVGTATNTGNLTTLTMTWTAGTGTTTYYTVYVFANGSALTTLTPGNVLTTTYSPMTTNVNYTFNVTGTNTIAGATSGNSLTSGFAAYYATPVGGAITLNSGLTPTSGTVTITAATNATSYTVYISTTTSYTGSVYSFSTSTTGSAVSFTPSPNLIVGTTYYAVLLPVNVSVNGTYSNSTSIVLMVIPSAPASLSVSMAGSLASFTIASSTYATSYTVTLFSNATNSNSGGTQVSNAGNPFSTASLTPTLSGSFSAAYYYATVTASNSAGTSSATTSAAVAVTLLYTFTGTLTFTPNGSTGRLGPTLSQCRTAYSSFGSWVNDSLYFNMTTQGYQLWTVPATRSYVIYCAGANSYKGASSINSTGKIFQFSQTLTINHVIAIVVGQSGQTSTSTCGHTYASGGGGSFIYNVTTSTLLAACGGGGGGCSSGGSTTFNYAANSGTSGSAGQGNYQGGPFAGGTGGGGGTGELGALCGPPGGGGGGGYTGNGSGQLVAGNPQSFAGNSYTNGATGGSPPTPGREGGFGGGGSSGYYCGGGAGGYSGGGAGAFLTACNCTNGAGGGGGGGSYCITTPSITDVNNADGYVSIT